MNHKITFKQWKVLLYINAYLIVYSNSPSIRDVAEYFKYSIAGARDHMERLKRKEYIEISPGLQRCIKITEKGKIVTTFNKVDTSNDYVA